MKDRSGLQSRGSAPSTAIAAVSLAMLIAAGMSSVFAQTNSPTAAWIQVGSGTGPAKVSVDRSSRLGATVTIEIPGIQTELVAINDAQYTKLTIPGAVSTGFGVGKAEVPAVPVLLARPTGSAVTFRILSIQTETLHLARVFPMQPPLKSGEQAGPVVVDASFYASDVDYPSSRLSSPSLATWRDLDVVNVHFYPVVVRPAQHEVIVTSRITFRADFSGGSYPRRVASWMPPLYRRLIQNYDDLRFMTTSIEPPGTKCLMFCYDACADNPALNDLRDTMTRLGDSTELIRVGGAGGMDTAAIKDTIIARYVQQDSVLRWVFLVGECNQIPPRANYWKDTLWPRPVPYSDYWYSDLTEGQRDSCDNYPEVGIARLSPGGSGGNQDLSNQVMKIMNYMMGMDTTGGWLNSITLVAHRDTLYPKAVRGAGTMTLSYYDYKRDTIMGCWGGFDNGDIVRAIDTTGTGVLIYLGHGEWDRWWAWNIAVPPDSWTIEDVGDLNNQHTPVVFNFACGCGDLGQPTCLSEQWVRKMPDLDGSGFGAVASYGSSDRESWSEPNCSECTVAVRAIGDIWEDTLQGGGHKYSGPVFDLGGIQMLMDADIATQWENDTTWKKCYCMNIYSFMWLGNPAMQIWSGGTPDTAHLTYPSWIPTGDGQPFTVTVKIGGRNVEGAQVCVRKYGDFYVVGTTDASGKVTFSLGCHDTGHVFVSASKGHCAEEPHTPMLPYFGTSYACVVGPEMTYPNWGRKLVREPNTDNFHVVYTSGGMTLYKRSTDGGVNWFAPEAIGLGTYPAAILASGPLGMGIVPWVVYVTPEGSIMRAVRYEGQWNQVVVFPGSEQARAGAPSLATDAVGTPDALAQVVFPVYDGDPPTENYVYYCSFKLDSVLEPVRLDSAGSTFCYGASIALTPGYGGHVAWARGESIYYRQRDTASVWSPPYRISQFDSLAITEPASHPSVEAYGDSVFCVWRGPNDLGGFPGDIWRRSRYLWNPVTWWENPSNQSQSPDSESDFPVMTTNFVTVWHEQVAPGNSDIWGRWLPDTASHPFFETSLLSRYPQVESWCGWSGPPQTPKTPLFRCWTVWTEQESFDVPECTLGFGWQDWNGLPTLGKGLGPCLHKDYELGLYYAAALGQPEQSPYCLSRGGFAQFESWNADTSATGLTYRLPYLDPRRTYRLRAVLYHEGDGTWKADWRCDSGPWSHVKVAPRVPDTIWVKVPKPAYTNDARIVVELARATGDYVSLAELKLFQIEEEAGEGGGVQSLDYGRVFVTHLRGCTPNPFSRRTSVNYELAQHGPVELTVHDVSGRLVRRLESGPRHRGFHAARWDGTDGRGRNVPAGVYFVRFSAGGKTSTGRMTLVR